MPKYSTLKACLIAAIFSACSQQQEVEITQEEPEVIKPVFNPPTPIKLDDLSAFKKTSANWSVAGDVFADRSKEKSLTRKDGTGILANIDIEGKNQHLFTAFEHGDLELEFDVMMPKGSNSGVYFQSRYEIQLFDSWGVKKPQASDIGGIYQRWDASRGKGNEGYEGHPPKINAGRAPGLWQNFKIIFHAPKFDPSGTKIKNAWFEEVWLNGVLIHEYVSLNGTTRAAPFTDEVASAPLMIQGDHGPVAFRNIKYRKYNGESVVLTELRLRQYKSTKDTIPAFEALELVSDNPVEQISYKHTTQRDKYLMRYNATIDIPADDEYIISANLAQAGVRLMIGENTILNSLYEGDYYTPLEKVLKLKKGSYSFEFVYNKPRGRWSRGLALFIEGSNMQKQRLHDKESEFNPFDTEPIELLVGAEPVLQRSFVMFGEKKRTHAISVGTPTGLHYSYDLEMGTLLYVWDAKFFDVTQMWFGRGQPQLGRPIGPALALHGEPELAILEDENQAWPDTLSQAMNFKQIGYSIDKQGLPVFSYESHGITVSHTLTPDKKNRELKRTINFSKHKGCAIKIAEGSIIEKLDENSYAIDDKTYYVSFEAGAKTIQRTIDGKDELILKVPSETSSIVYNIIW